MLMPTGHDLYVVTSKAGKRLSKPMGKAAAAKRLRQVEYFKHAKGKR